jgi:biopolymer transport protein ExbD
MNLNNALGRSRDKRSVDTEINLTGVMNVFLIMIPFLLLTAVFMRISVLELSLPSLDKKSAEVKEQKPKSVVLNFLAVRENGFELRVPDLKLPDIPKKNNIYDWETLVSQLKQAKEKYPDSEDIIISPENAIIYDTIVTIMDRCREVGFPNISISG